MKHASKQTPTRLRFALALAGVLLFAQFLVAHHAVAHLWEKSPAQEKHESACDTCMAGHVLGAAVAAVAVFVAPVCRPAFARAVLRRLTVATAAKAFLSTGPPLSA